MKKEHTSHKRQSSRPSTKHTPDLFQPRPFAPTPETQTPTTQTPDLNGPISGPSLRTFSIQDPNGPRRQPIQPKLTIGAPGDKYEQEADRVASQVVQQIHAPQTNAPLQRDALEANKLQMRPILQRNTPEENELQRSPILQRNTLEENELQMRPTTEAVAGGPASDALESAISQARGSGQSLDPNLQQQMGQAIGADFSGVKVHTDTQSDQMNRSIQAKAFTTGQDIFFRQGAYQPGGRDGQELIAHELTHVVQQNGRSVQAMMLTPGLNQVIQARKITNDADLTQDVEDAQKQVGGAEHLTVLAVLQKIAGYFETDVSGATKASETFAILSNDTNRVIDADDLQVIAQIVQDRMKLVAKKAFREEREHLYEVMPDILYDHKQLQGKAKWNAEMDKYLKVEMDMLCDTSWHIDQASIPEEIAERREQRQAGWLDQAWKKVGELRPLGSSTPVKNDLWGFLGWNIKGLEWTMRNVSAGPTGTKLHLTVSGNSMLAPSTLVTQDADILNKSPDLIYSKLFESVSVDKRVHVTRESEPKKHLYIGGTNGLGMAIEDGDWGGDAKTMKEHLNSFKANVIQKIIDAKLKGWKLK